MPYLEGREDPRDPSPAAYSRLPPSLRYINLSGGEPFLRDDLPGLVETVARQCPKARIVISTNGLLPGKIEEQSQAIRQIVGNRLGVGVSIDGIGEIHDRIRGVPGAFEKALKSVERLKGLGVKDLGIGATLCDENVHQVAEVYQLSQELGVKFVLTVVHNSDHFFRTTHNRVTRLPLLRQGLDRIIGAELRSWQPKKWFKAFFYEGLYDYAAGKPRQIPCQAASASFFLSPSGDVYPCNVFDEIMGNIREGGFEAIWASQRAAAVRKKVESCPHGCWMVCTAISAIRSHLFQAGWWVAKNQLSFKF